MVICDELHLEEWVPDLSGSGQRDPVWTRVSYGDVPLVNSVEWADWTSNPVQVLLCERCGMAGCRDGGYVHLSRLGDLVVWSAPQGGEMAEGAGSGGEPAPAVYTSGAVAFSESAWRRLRSLDERVPPPVELPRATRRVLADSWRLSAPGTVRVERLDQVLPLLREQSVGTDKLELEEALRALTPLVGWLAEEPDRPIAGGIVEAESVGAEVETLYFYEPGLEDWPAFAFRDLSPLLALSRGLVFVPGQPMSKP